MIAGVQNCKNERAVNSLVTGTQQTRFGECLFGRPIIAYDFRIKVWWKLELLFSSYFRDRGNVMPVVLEEIKMQRQLLNSGNNNSFPRIFLNLKVQLAYPKRYSLISV